MAPSTLTITRAQVAAEASLTNHLEVRLTFSPGDSGAFDRLAANYFQRQVAIVMFGRVLSAPTINAVQYNGTAIVSSVEPQTAADMIASLSG